MTVRRPKTRLLSLCVLLSILVHCLALCGVRMLGSYRFGAAVGAAAVLVDLRELPAPAAAAGGHPSRPPAQGETAQGETAQGEPAPAPAVAGEEIAAAARAELPVSAAPPESPDRGSPAPAPDAVEESASAEPEDKSDAGSAPAGEKAAEAVPAQGGPPSGAAATEKAPAFHFAREERLTYLISMLGLPIGKAELESRNDERGTTISLRVRSNPALAGVYPVDDLVETRHVDGRFLMTKVRQREGAFRSDESFSINFHEKRVTWTDNITYRNVKLSVPTDEVLDTLSGIYSLRSRQLQVGRTETLHIFDSEKYAEVPVEVVRREEMRLPNLAQVGALVVRPVQQTAGIFRRTGDILIWLTDDADKVPVKIVTTIALGRVTAELVAAESLPHREAKVTAD